MSAWPQGMRVWHDPARLSRFPEARTRAELFERSDGVHWRMSYRLRGTTIVCAHAQTGFATEAAARDYLVALVQAALMQGQLHRGSG